MVQTVKNYFGVTSVTTKYRASLQSFARKKYRTIDALSVGTDKVITSGSKMELVPQGMNQ